MRRRTFQDRPAPRTGATATAIVSRTFAALSLVALLVACESKPKLTGQAWSCVSSNDCSAGEICTQGACAVPCATENDCASLSGHRCVAGGCRSAAWVPPSDTSGGDAGPCGASAECTTGSVQNGNCGNCGTKTRVCGADCAWGDWSSCQDEGTCTPEARDTAPCGTCGVRYRECDATCEWGDWGECQAGECQPDDPDDVEPCGDRCGTRRRSCLTDCRWGEWSECEGAGECAPDEESQEVCGNCGTATWTCNDDCEWEQGECLSEGECRVGAEEARACGNCGTQQWRCDDSCTWQPDGECAEQGECAPDDQEFRDCPQGCQTEFRSCDESCTWSTWSGCTEECEPSEVDEEACPDCGLRSRACGNDCRWGEWSRCSGDPRCGPSEICSVSGRCKGSMMSFAGGSFLMGSPAGAGFPSDERPSHPVSLAPFDLDRFEVSAGEYMLFLRAGGYSATSAETFIHHTDPDSPIEFAEGIVRAKVAACQTATGGAADGDCTDHPVTQVTWLGALAYCDWVNKRLPTEAEWEYAARGEGDDGRVYPWGDQAPTAGLANCDAECADGFAGSAPVGTFPDGATPDGVFDLAGNVWEWVQDYYHQTYSGAPIDGSAWLDPVGTTRVVRGGSWSSPVDDIRGARRAHWDPESTPVTAVGFRCAR